MKVLKMSKLLVLPTAAVTSKLAYIGQSGSGKTYGAGKFVEECLEIGAQIIVVDNVGIWWGLRLAANGKSAGISIPVFGGEHADAPLNPDSGVFMAKLIAEKKFSCILDVSDFTEGEKHRWTEAFAKEFLFQKKRHKSAVNIVWEEAHEFVPEFAPKDEARMLGAMQRLIKKGRNYGIGTTLISQQPQSVSKSVLNQTEILFAFKANGKHERKAIKDWIVYNHVENAVQEAVDILPELEPGECFVWSPTMLKVFERVKILKKWTFDASATPEFDEGEVKTGTLAKIDLKKISKEMEGLLEKAKEDNPEYLRQQIVELKKELEMARKQMKTKDVPVLNERDFKRLAKLLGPVSEQIRNLEQRLAKVDPTKQYQVPALVQNARPEPSKPVRRVLVYKGEEHEMRPAPRPTVSVRPVKAANGEKKLMGKAIEMLRILYLYPEGLTRTELAVRSVILQSGTFSNYVGDLRTAGCIENRSDRLVISPIGKEMAKRYYPNGVGSRPTQAELVQAWKEKHLMGKAKELLDVIVHHGGQVVSRAELADVVGMEMSGTFSNYIGDIRKSGLIESSKDIRASQALLTA